jgi:hypothetical protein
MDPAFSQNDVLLEQLTQLFVEIKEFCTETPIKWPTVYLMRQIVKKFGTEYLKELLMSDALSWIDQTEDGGQSVDMFVIYGDEYIVIRDLLTRVTLGDKIDQLERAYAEFQNSSLRNQLFLLAIYREIIERKCLQDDERSISSEIVDSVELFIQQHDITMHIPQLEAVFRNETGHYLTLTRDTPSRELPVIELVVHFITVVSTMTSPVGLNSPLFNLVNSPDKMKGMLLPTMPQDDLPDVFKYFVGKRVASENTKFYKCPNGHVYAIGDCGRPYVLSKCPECKADIGGQRHKLTTDNVILPDQNNAIDRTKPGHVIGAAKMFQSAEPQRRLNPVQMAILRNLLHLAMFSGLHDNRQAVCDLIDPAITVEDCDRFLWEHINADLAIIGRALDKNKDDVLVIMHSILRTIFIDSINADADANVTEEVDIQSNEGRTSWEALYVNRYISPVLNDMNQKLDTVNKLMEYDCKRIGNNPIHQLLFEVDSPIDQVQLEHIENIPSMWHYRNHISVENARFHFYQLDTKVEHPVLRLFFQKETELRMLRLLPEIVQLCQVVQKRFSRRIDRVEAADLTIGSSEFLQALAHDSSVQKELSRYVDSFQFAWNSTKDQIIGTNEQLSELLELTVDPDTAVSVLMPSSKGLGQCSLALISYLCQVQNQFMEEYSYVTKQKLESKVNVQDADQSHLIAFDNQKDLLQVLLANCNYSLEAGRGTVVEYDFDTVERQIEDRFVRGRPRLDSSQLDCLIFRQSLNTVNAIKQLSLKIDQEPLPMNVTHELEEEYDSRLTDISDMLLNIEIAVGYLNSVNEHADSLLQDFMTNTLKIDRKIVRRGRIHVKHTKSLWLLLAHLQAKSLASLRQDPFDSVDRKYCQPLTDGLQEACRRSLLSVNLDVFMSALHECIVLQLSSSSSSEAEHQDDSPQYGLSDIFAEYLESTSLSYGPDVIDGVRLPDEVKVAHCTALWQLACNMNRENVE